MSTQFKIIKLKDSISKHAFNHSLISDTYSIEFILDNIDIKADNVVQVDSLKEAEEIVNSIITENVCGINNKVKSYSLPLFLTAILILPK